jgi:phage terminase large subunit GpA-like protein
VKHVVTVANAERIAWLTIADVIEPPPPVDYVKWAETNIVFSKREGPFEGPYNRDLFGFFDEVLRALAPSDPCRVVTLKGSAQIGKTVVANVFCGGSMDMDPGDFLYVHPTEDNASRWSKLKLVPFIRSTTALTAIFPQRSRDGADSILFKERRDGRGALLISGANSPASLSQVSMPRQVQDDLAKWEMNAGGDPETQADSRSRAYEFAKLLKTSTPLVEPGCRITKSYGAGSQERYYLPCPHCEHMQTLEWENLLENLDEEHPENAHFTCIECGAVIEQHHLPAMRRGGEWRADNPAARRVHRSFYIWSAYSPLQSWERIAQEWINAKGDPKSEQTFLNDTVGRAYKAAGVAPPWEDLRDRGEKSERPVERVPAGYVILTAGVDCQKDRCEYQVVARARNRRKAIVTHGVIPHHISTAEAQASLDALLEQGFLNAYERPLTIDMLAIDGNAWTADVWAWAKKHPSSRVIMVRGVPSESAALLVRVKKERGKSGKLLPYSRRFYNFATSVLKWGVYRDLEKLDPEERGYVDLPKGLADSYYRQLTSETRKEVRDKKSGALTYRWVEDPNERNEALDTFNQAEAAWIRISGPTRELLDGIWDRYEAEREVPPAELQLDLEDVFHAGKTPAAKEGVSGPKTGSASEQVSRRRFAKRRMRTI